MKFKVPQILNQGDCWLGTRKEQREKGKERTKRKEEGKAARGGRSMKADTHRQEPWMGEREGRPGQCGWRGDRAAGVRSVTEAQVLLLAWLLTWMMVAGINYYQTLL